MMRLNRFAFGKTRFFLIVMIQTSIFTVTQSSEQSEQGWNFRRRFSGLPLAQARSGIDVAHNQRKRGL